MKKIITILILILTYAGLLAQAPQKFSYQAVVRNTTGTLVALKPVGVRISILQGSEFGAAVYVETHTPTTNLNGLLSINIGGGTAVLGLFEGINWKNGPYFLKSEMDPLGGTSYSITGTQPLMSVPYAIYTEQANSSLRSDSADYANSAGKAMIADSLNAATAFITPSQIKPGSALADQYLKWNGATWIPSSIPQIKAGNGIGVDNGTIGAPWSAGGLGPYTDSLRVGIGTNTPISKLNVSGSGFDVISTNFEGSGWNSFYRYGRYLGYIGSYNDTNSLDFGTNGNGNVYIVTNAYPRLTVENSTGRVGINTISPTNTLDVNGGLTTLALKLPTGAANGRVLTSDASGNASWGAVPGKQIIGVYPLNGNTGGPFVSQTGYVFIGPTASITITSTGDIITGSFQVPVATATGIATNVRFGLGYQLGAGTITNFTANSYSLVSIGTERHNQSAAASITGLAPGTYTVGVVIYNSTAVSINANDYQNGYFMLIR